MKASPDYKAIVHEHPQPCTSWGPNGTDAWFTGPIKDHHQCYHMYIMDIKKYRIYKDVASLPKFCTIPKI